MDELVAPASTSTAAQIATLVAAGELSPVEAVDAAIDRAQLVQGHLNCFTEVWEDEARQAARHAADVVVRGDALGMLHGVPVAVKDTTPVAGHRTTLGSYAFEQWVPDRDA